MQDTFIDISFTVVALMGALLCFWMICERVTVKMNYYPLETIAGWNQLTKQEFEAYILLAEVKGDSIWGIAIQRVLQENNVARFRQLICELKSQADDEPDTMKRIIGQEAYNAVVCL